MYTYRFLLPSASTSLYVTFNVKTAHCLICKIWCERVFRPEDEKSLYRKRKTNFFLLIYYVAMLPQICAVRQYIFHEWGDVFYPSPFCLLFPLSKCLLLSHPSAQTLNATVSHFLQPISSAGTFQSWEPRVGRVQAGKPWAGKFLWSQIVISQFESVQSEKNSPLQHQPERKKPSF